jgi:carbonic anhydrase
MKLLSFPSFSALLRPLSLLVLLTVAAVSRADEWEKIVGSNERTVEIDSASIFNSDHGTKVSWGRVVLGSAESERSGYHTIKALNRYDCVHRSFVTIKRVYLDSNENVVREESPDQMPTLVRRNSVDERIWRKMCGPTPTNPTRPGSAENGVDRLATHAERVAQSATRAAQIAPATLAKPAPASVAPPPKLAPIPVAVPAPVEAAPEKAAVVEPPEKAALIKTTLKAPAPKEEAKATAPAPAPRFEPTPAASPMKRPARVALTPAPPPPVVAAAPVAHQLPKKAVPLPGAAAHTLGSWSYHGSGGPEFWGRMRPEWRLCGEGMRQSPLDFAASAPVAVNLDPVKFDYRSTRFFITNTDLQLRIRVDAGMGMEVRGQRYSLEGFTLHHPAETQIDGKAADMSVHFYHRDGDGQVAVLAVQAMRGDKSNALLQTLLNNLPLERGGSYMPDLMVDIGAFLPASPAHFLYMGSITTPPCAEGVLWVVLKEPVMLSDEQYDIFVRLHESNARPVQPANARLVLESR